MGYFDSTIELFKLLYEEMMALDRPVLVCAVVIFVTFVVELILVANNKILKNDDKQQIAKDRGNVITAKRIHVRRVARFRTGNKSPRWTARYEYFVGKKKKHYAVVSDYGEPPMMLGLYYLKSPNKVFSSYDYKSSVPILYILPIILGGIACYIAKFYFG